MSTIGKALGLLDAISRLDREHGLSDIARLCALDKATTRRFLVELERHGFVEQDAETRKYRIGAEPVRLARIREARFPFLSLAVPVLRDLAAASTETVHLAEYSAGRLSNIHVEMSPRAHCVTVDVGSVLPFHATASGLAFLAFSPAGLAEQMLAEPLQAFTRYTLTRAPDLRAMLSETAERGFSISRQGLEAGVVSTAAPVRAPDGTPIGTVAIAAPLVRVSAARILELGQQVAEAAGQISDAFFGLGQPAPTLSRKAG